MAAIRYWGKLSPVATSEMLDDGPSFMSGAVIWCDSVSGNDANNGTSRKTPRKTFASARGLLTTLKSDLLVLMDGFSETISGAVTETKAGIHIISEIASGLGQARLIAGVDSALTFSGADVSITGVKFPAAAVSVPTLKLAMTGARAVLDTCAFEFGANDGGVGVQMSAVGGRISNSTFTATGANPAQACQLNGATAGYVIEQCTFDASSYFWTTGTALNVPSAAVNFVMSRNRLYNGSVIAIATGATGHIYFDSTADIDAASGNGINWTP